MLADVGIKKGPPELVVGVVVRRRQRVVVAATLAKYSTDDANSHLVAPLVNSFGGNRRFGCTCASLLCCYVERIAAIDVAESR